MSNISRDGQTPIATPLIGLLDSGVSPAQIVQVVAARSFEGGASNGGVSALPEQAMLDQLGHGSTLASIISAQVPQARLLVAKIFINRLVTSARQTAAGLDWLVEQGAGVVNMSFGLGADRPVLAQACQRALDAGVILVAAAPAVGPPVYPSSYAGVLRVTGDARCDGAEISYMGTRQADFGACVRARASGVAGASVATAHICARIAKLMATGDNGRSLPREQLIHRLRAEATYRGPQRHFTAGPADRSLTRSVPAGADHGKG